VDAIFPGMVGSQSTTEDGGMGNTDRREKQAGILVNCEYRLFDQD